MRFEERSGQVWQVQAIQGRHVIRGLAIVGGRSAATSKQAASTFLKDTSSAAQLPHRLNPTIIHSPPTHNLQWPPK
jgi:hypothetical protein